MSLLSTLLQEVTSDPTGEALSAFERGIHTLGVYYTVRGCSESIAWSR